MAQCCAQRPQFQCTSQNAAISSCRVPPSCQLCASTLKLWAPSPARKQPEHRTYPKLSVSAASSSPPSPHKSLYKDQQMKPIWLPPVNLSFSIVYINSKVHKAKRFCLLQQAAGRRKPGSLPKTLGEPTPWPAP